MCDFKTLHMTLHVTLCPIAEILHMAHCTSWPMWGASPTERKKMLSRSTPPKLPNLQSHPPNQSARKHDRIVFKQKIITLIPATGFSMVFLGSTWAFRGPHGAEPVEKTVVEVVNSKSVEPYSPTLQFCDGGQIYTSSTHSCNFHLFILGRVLFVNRIPAGFSKGYQISDPRVSIGRHFSPRDAAEFMKLYSLNESLCGIGWVFGQY